jgi:hypothetical protein
MRRPIRKLLILIVVLLFSTLFLAIVYGSGGRIEGRVTDPKGASVVGATVTVVDPLSQHRFTTTSDDKGRYNVEGLPGGVFTVVVTAKGFQDGRRENVKIEEDKATTIDFQLQISPVEAEVNVSTSGRANADPVYRQLRLLAANRV